MTQADSDPLQAGEGAGGRLHWVIWGSCAGLLLGLSLALGADLGGFGGWVWLLMLGSLVGGLLAVATAWVWRGRPVTRAWIFATLLVAVAARLLLLPTDRFLSDDAFRYHWDGKVLVSGINPYRHAPADRALDHLATDAIDTQINHPKVRTVYPPVAQLYFALGYVISPGRLLGFQLLALLAELAGWLLLLWELRRRALPGARIVLAAWFPLVLYESYLPGHVDTLALPWLTLFVLALSGRRAVVASAALAVACLIKPVAIIFLPVAARQVGWKKSLLAAAVFLGLVTLAYLPFISAGDGLYSSLWLMAQKWSINGSLAAGLEAVLPQATARLGAAAILAVLLLVVPFVGRDLLARLLLAWTAFVICTPNLYPWYAVWMLPLLVLRPDPALIALGLLLPLTEVVNIAWRLQGVWQPPLWPPLVMYAVFYPLLVLGAWRGWGMWQREAPATGQAVRPGTDPRARTW